MMQSEGHRWSAKLLWLLAASLTPALASGDQRCPMITIAVDAKLDRIAAEASKAYAEGDLKAARKGYLRAWVRSWAIDDPYQSGTIAYNLAAIEVTGGRLHEASDYLTDAMADLRRANCSTANVYLLRSGIARQRGQLDEADRLITVAASRPAPCPPPEEGCGGEACGCPGCNAICVPEACQDGCCETFLRKVPLLGKHLKRRDRNQDCCNGHEARIHLSSARVDLQAGSLGQAQRHLCDAIESAAGVCDYTLLADIDDVAASLFTRRGNFLAAASRYDRQVNYLRMAKEYREIPDVLIASGDALATIEAYAPAASRYNRAARVYYARGQYQQAWDLIRTASVWVSQTRCGGTQIRLAMTARWIRDALQPDDGMIDPDRPEEGVHLELPPLPAG